MNNLATIDDIDIKSMIYEIRGKQVMIDSDLAMLYKCVNGAKSINLAVKRNMDRFPDRFCFQLTKNEYKEIRVKVLKFQNETSKADNRGGKQKLPYVFTEQGVAMLSSVLRTNVATEISVKIMDAFVEMRRFIINNANIFERLTNVEYKLLEHDKNFDRLFDLFQKEKEFKNKLFYEGQIYDAYSILIDLIKVANKKIIIIDNYIDKSILDILSKKQKDVEVKIISKNSLKLSELDIDKFNKQYPKLEIFYSSEFHDRFIIIDNEIVYHLGASLKDLGSKCFCISKLEDKTLLDRIAI